MPPSPPERRTTSFKGDVLRLVSGTSAAALITVLVTPILSRLYPPEAFGVAALFTAVTGIIGVLVCMRYELSIVLPDDHREAANLLAVSLIFSALISFATVPLIWYGGPLLLVWASMPELIPYIWLLPVMLLIHGIFLGLNYWNTRTKHFARLSVARALGTSATAAGGLGAGLAGQVTGGALIAAQVGGQAIATTVLGGQIWRDNGRFILNSLNLREMVTGATRHYRFPVFSTWTALLNSASLQFAPLLLVSLYGTAVAGFYALTLRVLSMPSSLIGSAVGNVFLSRAPQASRDGTLPILVEMIHRKLAVFGIPTMVVLLFFGPDLFVILFGEQWYKAGQYARWMAPWVYLQFQWSPLSSLASVLDLQREALVAQSLTFFVRVGSLVFCAWYGTSAETAVLFFAIVSALSYLSRQVWFIRRAGADPRTLLSKDMADTLLLCLIVSPAVWLNSSSTFYGSLVFTAAYLFLVLLWWFWHRLGRSFWRNHGI
jgi:O-antigen/teichoic acid export membrane protein